MIHPYTYVGLNMPKEKRTVLCDTIINICKIIYLKKNLKNI